MNHIDIAPTVTTLDHHIIWLECLADSMARQDMAPGVIEQARNYARGLDKLSKQLATFMPGDTVHRLERPYASGVIEVYREPSMGWYEWRIVDDGQVLHDSGTQANHDGTRGAMYGVAGIALRDALNHDEPPRQPAVVEPVEWLPTRSASRDNLAQLERLMATVQALADTLASTSADAKAKRSTRNPDHAEGRLAMIYYDERTRLHDELADTMTTAAERLRALAERLSRESAG